MADHLHHHHHHPHPHQGQGRPHRRDHTPIKAHRTRRCRQTDEIATLSRPARNTASSSSSSSLSPPSGSPLASASASASGLHSTRTTSSFSYFIDEQSFPRSASCYNLHNLSAGQRSYIERDQAQTSDFDPDRTPRKGSYIPSFIASASNQVSSQSRARHRQSLSDAFDLAVYRGSNSIVNDSMTYREDGGGPMAARASGSTSNRDSFLGMSVSMTKSRCGHEKATTHNDPLSPFASPSPSPHPPQKQSSRSSLRTPANPLSTTSGSVTAATERPVSSLARSTRPRRSELHEQEVHAIRSQSRAGFTRIVGTEKDSEDDTDQEVAQELANADGAASIIRPPSTMVRPGRGSRPRASPPSSLIDRTSVVTSAPTSETEHEIPTRRSSMADRRRYASDLDTSFDSTANQRLLHNFLPTSPSTNSLQLRTQSAARMSYQPLPRPVTSVGVRAYSRSGSMAGGEGDWDRAGASTVKTSGDPLSPTEIARIRKLSSLSAESAGPPSSYRYGVSRSDIFSGPRGPSSQLGSGSDRLKVLQDRREALQRPSTDVARHPNGSAALSSSSAMVNGGSLVPSQTHERPPSRSASVAGASSSTRHHRAVPQAGTAAQYTGLQRSHERYSASEIGGDRQRLFSQSPRADPISTRSLQGPTTPTTTNVSRTILSTLSGGGLHSRSRSAMGPRNGLPSSISAPVLPQHYENDPLTAPERNMLVSLDLFERYFSRARSTPDSDNLSRGQSSTHELVDKSSQFVDTVSALNAGIRELAQHTIQREIEAELSGDMEEVGRLRSVDAMLSQLLKHSDKQVRGMGELLSTIIRVDKDMGVAAVNNVSSRRAESRLGTTAIAGRAESTRDQMTPVSSSMSASGAELMRKSATLSHSSSLRTERWQSQAQSVPAKLRREQRNIRTIADTLKGTPSRVAGQIGGRDSAILSTAAVPLLSDQSISFEVDENINRSPSTSYLTRRSQADGQYVASRHVRSSSVLPDQAPLADGTSLPSPSQRRRDLPHLSRYESASAVARSSGFVTGLSPRLPRLSTPSVDTATAVARSEPAQLETLRHARRSAVDLVGDEGAHPQLFHQSSPASIPSDAETLRHRMVSSHGEHGGTADSDVKYDDEGKNSLNRLAHQSSDSSILSSSSKAAATGPTPPRPPKASRRSRSDVALPDQTYSLSAGVRSAEGGGDALTNDGIARTGTAIIQPATEDARSVLKRVERSFGERDRQTEWA